MPDINHVLRFESALKKALKGAWKQAILAGLFCAVPAWITTQLVGVESTEEVVTIGVVGAATFLVGAAIVGVIFLKVLELPKLGSEANAASDIKDVLKVFALGVLGLVLGFLLAHFVQVLTQSILLSGGQGWAIFGQMLGAAWVTRVFTVELGKLEKEVDQLR